ncbi:MAG: SAM-dependent methyltransferase [Bacteroidota bacterium]
MKGKLYLIPCSLGGTPSADLGPRVADTIASLSHFIVENERSARRFIKALLPSYPIADATLYLIDKHNVQANIKTFLDPCESGISVGLLSEAGCPAIADPGEEVVELAHQKNIIVVPLVGPSSILLTLMGSGLNGENFAFSGYLPIDKSARVKKIKELEQKALKENQTQLFMDTPFRNNQLLEDVLLNCSPALRVCIGTDLTLDSERINTRTVAEWKKNTPDLHKRLVMFGMGR